MTLGQVRRSSKSIGQSEAVQDDLFGENNSAKVRGNSAHGSRLKASIRGSLGGAELTVLSHDDIVRMKEESRILTHEEAKKLRTEREKLEQEQRKMARERKTKMKELEEESRTKRINGEMDPEVEQLREAKNSIATSERILHLARKQQDDQLDVVKHLTSLQAQAAAFMLRDQQITEKKKRLEKDRAYNKHFDMEMEVNRIQDIRRREREEAEKASRRIRDRQMIEVQIEERKKAKLREEESKALEGDKLKQLFASYGEEEKQKEVEKLENIKKTQEEVVKANVRNIEAKKRFKVREEEESKMILKYQLDKAKEEEKRLEAQQRIKKAAEARTAKLRAQQERAQDKASEIDALRAKKSAETKEREARAREKEEKAKRAHDQQQILHDLQQQHEYKKKFADRENQRQIQEHNEIMRKIVADAKKEEVDEEARAVERQKHVAFLQAQIEETRERKKKRKEDELREGLKIKTQIEQEARRVEKIKDSRIKELLAAGYKPEYLVDMQAMDVAKIQLR